MSGFIFGLNTQDSILLIAWCLIFLLSIGIAIKAKSKFLTFVLLGFILVNALKIFTVLFPDVLNNYAADHNLYVLLLIANFILALLDVTIAVLFAFPKTRLNKPIWVVFVTLNIIAVLGANLSYFSSFLFSFMQETIGESNVQAINNIVNPISAYALYVRPGITLVAFVALILLKRRAAAPIAIEAVSPEEASVATQTESQGLPPTETDTADDLSDTTQQDAKNQPSEKSVLEQQAETTQVQIDDEEQDSQQSDSSEEKYCNSCGYSEKTDKTICPRCFNPMSVLIECPVCHNKTTGNFCGRCGKKVK